MNSFIYLFMKVATCKKISMNAHITNTFPSLTNVLSQLVCEYSQRLEKCMLFPGVGFTFLMISKHLVLCFSASLSSLSPQVTFILALGTYFCQI